MNGKHFLIVGGFWFASFGCATAQDWYATSLPVANWTGLAMSVDGTTFLAVNTYPNGAIWVSTNSGLVWRQAPFLRFPGPGAELLEMRGFISGRNEARGGGGTVSTRRGGDRSDLHFDEFRNELEVEQCAPRILVFGGMFRRWNQTRGRRVQRPDLHLDKFRHRLGFKQRPAKTWYAVTSSADGTRLTAAPRSGPVYNSTNSGTTWVPGGLPTRGATVLASSADGTSLLAGAPAGPAYGAICRSTNSGATWNQTGPPTNSWYAVASSADGTKLVAAGSQIYTSSDSGATWDLSRAPTSPWSALVSAADGSSLLAATSTGQVYATVPALNISNSGGNLTLTWPAGAAFRLQQNSDPTTTNWATMTNGPILANGQSRVTVSPAGAQGFYRLIYP